MNADFPNSLLTQAIMKNYFGPVAQQVTPPKSKNWGLRATATEVMAERASDWVTGQVKTCVIGSTSSQGQNHTIGSSWTATPDQGRELGAGSPTERYSSLLMEENRHRGWENVWQKERGVGEGGTRGHWECICELGLCSLSLGRWPSCLLKKSLERKG